MAVNSVTTSNVRWYNGNPTGDGVGLGKTTTSKVGFWGLTPIVRPTVTAVSSSAATTTLNETRITRIQALLVTLGLCATA
jgi:hypothetical protein